MVFEVDAPEAVDAADDIDDADGEYLPFVTAVEDEDKEVASIKPKVCIGPLRGSGLVTSGSSAG